MASDCRCILTEHCDPKRPNCRLRAGAPVDQGGGIGGLYQPPLDAIDVPRIRAEARAEGEAARTAEIVAWLRSVALGFIAGTQADRAALAECLAAKFNREANDGE